jgi:DNA repair exonuclease SbcCD nuclease subunit
MRFLFCTDLHLTGRNPPNRTDKYPSTLIAKMNEVYSIAARNQVDFVLFGGDLFDSHRCYAYEVLTEAVRTFRNAPCLTYMIIGQHDLIGYNRSSFTYSTAHFVSELSGNMLRVLNEPECRTDATIFPCHVFDKLPEVMQQAGASGKPCPIVVAHALVTEKRAVYDTILIDSLPETNVGLVLCGDYHGGFDLVQRGNTLFYNPGAMSRQKATTGEMKRVVQCAVVEVMRGIIRVSPIPLTSALPSASVFAEPEQEEKPDGVNIDPFIEKLEQLACEATDIFQLLNMMAGPDANPQVMGYINSFRKSEQ